MEKNKYNLLKKIAHPIKNGLPHAFDYLYWDMANTTYKEELALTYIETLKLKKDEAKTFLRMCGIYKNTFPIIYYMLDGHIEESMGSHYGVTEKGKKFLNNYTTR